LRIRNRQPIERDAGRCQMHELAGAEHLGMLSQDLLNQ
jgi:hypothetical protein